MLLLTNTFLAYLCTCNPALVPLSRVQTKQTKKRRPRTESPPKQLPRPCSHQLASIRPSFRRAGPKSASKAAKSEPCMPLSQEPPTVSFQPQPMPHQRRLKITQINPKIIIKPMILNVLLYTTLHLQLAWPAWRGQTVKLSSSAGSDGTKSSPLFGPDWLPYSPSCGGE